MDAAVKDPGCWATFKVLHELQQVLTSLEGWSGGCPCHGDFLAADGLSRWHRNTRFVKMAGLDEGSFCPFAGCRCPEIAAGHIHQHVQDTITTKTMHVMLTALVHA